MGNLFVCIVSDAPENAASLALWLSLNGHRTADFGSVADLISSTEVTQLCAVIGDFKDGGSVDSDLARRLYERSPHTPLYFIANGWLTRGALMYASPNVTRIFDSPYSPEDLADAIQATCTCESIE